MTAKDVEMVTRQKLKDDYEHYALNALFIRPKDGNLVPFILNRGQKYIHSIVEDQRARTGKVRVLILKGRQMGCTTYIQGRYYWRVTHNAGVRAFILTHEEEATNNLFEMSKRFHENCLPALKPATRTSNAKELLFDALDSGYKLGTAGNKSVGRSSTIQFLHASEAAFYKHAEEHAKGIMQTVPDAAGTEIFIESTANGVGNWFHQQWQLAEAGQSDYIPIFVPWFWQAEYVKPVPDDFKLTDEEETLKSYYHLTDEQINWRRSKISDLSVNGVDGTKSFHQEYPCSANESFVLTGEDSYIAPDLVLRARKATNVEKYGHKIIGVDPARFGDDRTAIIKRQGRVAYDLQTYIKKDTMEIVGYVYQIILAENPDKVCIDIGGLGAGVYDRLCELVDRSILVAVNSGAGALDSRKYLNKRAEMWALGKKWLEDEPCLIPDSDELQADMCNAKYTVDSNSRLVIEKKETMKKRGVRSSDCADSFLLTFSVPELSLQTNSAGSQAKRVKQVMSKFTAIQKLNKNRKR